jgi:hypothetical protein
MNVKILCQENSKIYLSNSELICSMRDMTLLCLLMHECIPNYMYGYI